MSTPSIAFIGAGNMAFSIIGGLIKQGVDPKKVWATNIDQESLNKLEQEFQVNTTTDNHQAISEADVVVLSVKPQVLKSVVTDLAETLKQNNPLIISIAAGIKAETLQDWIGQPLAIVRCMPNTPALLQCGASGLYKTAEVTDEQANVAETLMNAVGITLWVQNEQGIDAVTAVSGSGPAYYFLFMEAMQQAGEALGLDAETAKQLTLQTALGAARMAIESDDAPSELRRKVTSPGGTTEQAIQTFQKGNLEALVKQAMQAASDRSEELSEILAK
ncbi:pyrroline-5-carboxylate reductase [Litoribrevibacter albus]|uniref:Pyrroline-5-carboxylate reductase n=1 Tax=Litoribrevibacter albus TaxID=1473156 RepID=A0AA37S989_9GAMM|nr:pyrroline-5-carboxylate reductase [Litoribrevibacter albus]GLQ30559.1 pyrroline-5-carboxylate reductase [Litoribrevibacter albus]